MALGKEGGDFLILHREADDAVLAGLPVRGRRELMFRGHLERIDDAENFSKVASGGGWVGKRQLDLLIRPDDEDGTNRGGIVHVGMNHVVGVGNLFGGVSDDGVVHRAALGFIDVADPAPVGFHRIDADRDDLHITLLELLLKLRDRAEFRGANGSIVFGVGK